MANEPIEVAAEVIGEETAIVPSNEIRVEYTPSSIADNIKSVEAYIDQQLKPFVGAKLDPNDEEQIKQGRQFMADLNKLKKPIDDERKRIKREYEKPLKAFEARVKEITDKIDEARGNLSKQVDAADEAFKERRRAMLAKEYEGCVGMLAEVIPFEVILEQGWLNRSTAETKAVNDMTGKSVRALEGYQTLQKKELVHKTEVVRHYCETLDLMGALQLEDELNEEDRQRAEFEERQRQAEAFKAARQAEQAEALAAERQLQRAETEAEAYAETPVAPDAPMEAPEPAQQQPRPAEPATAPNPDVFTWHLVIDSDFTATKEQARAVADALNSVGITGATIKCKGVKNA